MQALPPNRWPLDDMAFRTPSYRSMRCLHSAFCILHSVEA
jgi:hypothetical protein